MVIKLKALLECYKDLEEFKEQLEARPLMVKLFYLFVPNNWLRMHGYPMHKRKKNVSRNRTIR